MLAVGGFATRILRAPLTARAPLQSENCEAAGEVFLVSKIRRSMRRASSGEHRSARSQRRFSSAEDDRACRAGASAESYALKSFGAAAFAARRLRKLVGDG
ncbi:MAG: hypothetical protein WB774_19705, partial [Xanthobacteraceae bacterium]